MNAIIENIPSTLFQIGISNDKNSIEQNRIDENFSAQLKEAAIENIKAEIYEKFGVSVNAIKSNEECSIPIDVLYRMNTDSVLREKVFAVLADHRNAKRALAGYYPPVKKYTLIFDKNGDVVTYILEPDMEVLEKDCVKSRKNRIISDSLSRESYNDNLMNDNLYSLLQNIGMQSAMLQTVLIKKRQFDRNFE